LRAAARITFVVGSAAMSQTPVWLGSADSKRLL
jgi:hypothetical protein